MIEKIRQAVGAIIVQNNEYLLICKVKQMEGPDGPTNIDPIWDFPKGGVRPDEPNLDALWRELREETGSQQYRVRSQLPGSISFSFDTTTGQTIGYTRQETTMLLVEYMGDRSDLQPQDEEIDDVRFFQAEQVLRCLPHEESREFYQQFLLEKTE
jgi:putative (di)nucleoside polyphosphate hydrolase